MNSPSGFCRPGFTRARLFLVFVDGLRAYPPPPPSAVFGGCSLDARCKFCFSLLSLVFYARLWSARCSARGKGCDIRGVSPTHGFQCFFRWSPPARKPATHLFVHLA